MSTTCKNCDEQFEGNFCNNCGQSADTQRLNFKYLVNHLQRLFLKYFQKGIFYTSFQLFRRPGHTIREYIEGKRVKHFEPVSLLLMMATLYGVLYHYFQINLFTDISLKDTPYQKIDFKAVNEWISTHFSLATLLLIPFYSLGSFIAFRKQDYNYVEHLFLNTFLASQRLLLRIVSLPLLVIYNGKPQIHIVGDAYIVLDIILIFWSYIQFFNKLPKVKSILLSILSYVIFMAFFILLIVIGLTIGSMLTG